MVKVISVLPKNNYQLFVKLSNGKEGYFDISPYLEKGIFQELKDKNYFTQVNWYLVVLLGHILKTSVAIQLNMKCKSHKLPNL